jgi:hypothetical protein
MSDMGAGVLKMKDSHVREQEEHLSRVIHSVMAKRGYYSRPLQADLVSAVQAEVDRLVAEAALRGEQQGAINAIYRFKAERIEHTLTTEAGKWERELETADRVLATYLSELAQLRHNTNTGKGE